MSEGVMELDDKVVAELRVTLREMISAAQAATSAARALTEHIRAVLAAPEAAPTPLPEPRRLEVRVVDLRRGTDGTLMVDDDPTSWVTIWTREGLAETLTDHNQPFRVCPNPFERILTILGRACPTCRGTGDGLLAAAGGFSGGICPRCGGTGDLAEVP